MTTSPPRVLLLDDGELEDVASVLVELGVPFDRPREADYAPDQPPAQDLLLATTSRAKALGEPTDTERPSLPFRIVVCGDPRRSPVTPRAQWGSVRPVGIAPTPKVIAS